MSNRITKEWLDDLKELRQSFDGRISVSHADALIAEIEAAWDEIAEWERKSADDGENRLHQDLAFAQKLDTLDS